MQGSNPPEPKADKHTNKPSTNQFGEAPATMAKTEQIINEVLNANLRPIISADRPQNIAPASMPTYTAMVRPLEKFGWNSLAALVAIMLCTRRIWESTAYLGAISIQHSSLP